MKWTSNITHESIIMQYIIVISQDLVMLSHENSLFSRKALITTGEKLEICFCSLTLKLHLIYVIYQDYCMKNSKLLWSFIAIFKSFQSNVIFPSQVFFSAWGTMRTENTWLARMHKICKSKLQQLYFCARRQKQILPPGIS